MPLYEGKLGFMEAFHFTNNNFPWVIPPTETPSISLEESFESFLTLQLVSSGNEQYVGM